MRTSPGFGSGTSISTTCITSGPPVRSIWIPGAFTGRTAALTMEGVSITVVTGGAGFIGSHTVDRLLELGHHVVVLDDFSTGRRENLAHHGTSARLHVVACAIGEGIFAALAPLTSAHGPVERIVHLAAQVSVVHSVANPIADMRVNYGGTLHVLEYARATGVRRVVM